MGKAPELNYRSFLANDMRDYLDYLDHLGFSILVPAYRLKPIDRFLAENNITCIQQCDSRFWLSLLRQHQGRIKAITFQYWRRTFHKFCRYLVLQGRIAENPAALFPLPNPQPYRPYVFSLQELRRIFDFLQQKAETVIDHPNPYFFKHSPVKRGLNIIAEAPPRPVLRILGLLDMDQSSADLTCLI